MTTTVCAHVIIHGVQVHAAYFVSWLSFEFTYMDSQDKVARSASEDKWKMKPKKKKKQKRKIFEWRPKMDEAKSKQYK